MLNHLLAAVLFSQGKIQSARDHIGTCLAKRPDNTAAHLLAARIARAGRDFDRALAQLDRVIALAPQREAIFEKGARTLDQAGLRPQARQAWRAILEAAPKNPEAAARLGRLLWEDGDDATAVDLLERRHRKRSPGQCLV